MTTLQTRITQHQLLSELRVRLLRLHKVLLDRERTAYEQIAGKVSSGEMLQLVIGDAQFAWLHRLSELIVQIDELRQADEPITPDMVTVLLGDLRAMLTPNAAGDEFAIKYDRALQTSPDAVLAHAAVVALL
jgi:hypothetical protein